MDMQPAFGAFPDGEWDFSRIFSTEDLEFTPDFLSHFSFPDEGHEGSQFAAPSAFLLNPEEDMNMAGAEESLVFSWNNFNHNLHFIPQENGNSSNETYFFSDSGHSPAANANTMSMDVRIMDEKNCGSFSTPSFPEIAVTEIACINEEDVHSDMKRNLDNSQPATIAASAKELQLKRKSDAPESNGNQSEIMKKKPRITKDHAQKCNKKNAQSKKKQKSSPNSNDEEEEEERNMGRDGQSSRSYSSEDDNVSEDLNNGGTTSDSKVSEAPNSNPKTRASRGSATDPQSLYARKRRERINERLRILQNLVPNGTKVDISTMLEEAVHYVKFLQFQIKLLSSDDLWMYAPIAYNGIDIGLNQKISTLL